jgi:hypothetical protein
MHSKAEARLPPAGCFATFQTSPIARMQRTTRAKHHLIGLPILRCVTNSVPAGVSAGSKQGISLASRPGESDALEIRRRNSDNAGRAWSRNTWCRRCTRNCKSAPPWNREAGPCCSIRNLVGCPTLRVSPSTDERSEPPSVRARPTARALFVTALMRCVGPQQFAGRTIIRSEIIESRRDHHGAGYGRQQLGRRVLRKPSTDQLIEAHIEEALHFR